MARSASESGRGNLGGKSGTEGTGGAEGTRSGTTGTAAEGSTASPRTAGLAVLALGVVFGDIGTSPLYAFQQMFVGAYPLAPDKTTIYGSLSLIFWTITLIVSVKYVSIVMRADNDGEGGIMALAALTSRHHFSRPTTAAFLMGLGVLGASLFYGDSMITPAVSVLSAVEGLEVAAPQVAHLVLPLAVAILVALFAVQRWGTHAVGRAFGPVMLTWFLVIGLLGAASIAQSPGILVAISPTYAIAFFVAEPLPAFLSLGSVILCVTGAEALYADMGHFGRRPIRLAWFTVAALALYLNYLGQAALVERESAAAANPFYLMVPGVFQIPMVLLATLATVIASQAVITGAFSMTDQAMRLRFLPRMTVTHTSAHTRGQIYIPAVNWLLMVAVVGLVVGFGSSDHLASAYGLAVSGTFLITSILITVVARTHWRVPLVWLVPVAGFFICLDTIFFGANLTKVGHGGWFPLLVAVIVFLLLTTWNRGNSLVAQNSALMTMTDDQLRALVDSGAVFRPEGTAVYPTMSTRVPAALAEFVQLSHVMRANTIQIAIRTQRVPRVADADRVTVTEIFPGFTRVTIDHGFMQRIDVPGSVRLLRDRDMLCLPDDAVFVVHSVRVRTEGSSRMWRWRKHLYAVMVRNSADPAATLRLEGYQIVEYTSVVPI